MAKICWKCKDSKELDQFHKDKTKKDGLCSTCKECLKLRYKENKEELIKKSIEYLKNNPDKKKHHFEKWYRNNKDYFTKYYQNNKEHLTKLTIKRQKFRYQNDLNFKLKNNLRVRFWHAIKNGSKSKSIIKLLDCNIDELKIHLESQFKPEMTWENHGLIWEIDHILPVSKFDLTKLEEQQKCFHYTNLQPLFKLDNRIKYNKI